MPMRLYNFIGIILRARNAAAAIPADSNIILRLPVYGRIKAALVHATAIASIRIITLIKTI